MCYGPVSDKSAATLLPIIRRYSLPGTTIISDCWAAYSSLAQDSNFEYLKVNHSIKFVDSDVILYILRILRIVGSMPKRN